MNKVYYLSTCDTCNRIISDLALEEKQFIFQDIKTDKITLEQLNEMKKLAGSAEALFSRIARKYKELPKKPETEKEYESLILEEYTFLKRPVIVINKNIFIGNSKATIELARVALKS